MNTWFNSFTGNSLEDYLTLVASHPHLFCGDEVMQILLDRKEIEAAQEEERIRWLKQGIKPSMAWKWSRAGVIAFDPYVLWLRDAVKRPNGSRTLYKRILYSFLIRKGKGVAICGLTPQNELVMVDIWRHALQRWSLELPRGTPDYGELPIDCALREFEEETGHSVLEIQSMGLVAPDSGILGHEVEIFFARVGQESHPILLDEDCIRSVRRVPIDQLNKNALVCDSFLTIALHWMNEHVFV